MAVKAALSGINTPEELIRLAAIQTKSKAKLKHRIPFYGLSGEPLPDFPRRCHVGLLECYLDKCHLGLNIGQVSVIPALLDELIHTF